MAPSPRKRAQPAPFQQTWDDTDASFLDPSALPVAKVPRGWERKQEIKRFGDGKEKKIWRRISLRARGVPPPEQGEEEEHDARSRAVKRRQHMSPKAMEKSTTAPNSKTRAFRGTRWDRRKSVLPRKKTTRASVTSVEVVSDVDDDAYDATDVSTSNADFTDTDMAGAHTTEPTQSLPPNGEDTGAAFTFTMEEKTVDDLPDHENRNHSVEPSPAEDATINMLFRSPPQSAPTRLSQMPEKVEYPELPNNDKIGQDATAIHMPKKNNVHQQTDLPESSTEEDGQEIQENTPLEPQTDSNEVVYPALPSETPSTEPCEILSSPVADEDSECEDVEMSEIEVNLDATRKYEANAYESPAVVKSPEEGPDDDHSIEASIQLDIQRQCDASLSEDQPRETPANDITTGLTLTPAKPPPAESTPRKLHSPPPPSVSEVGLDDVTMTVSLDDDTAILKDFLNRAAASKAERGTIVHRRESLQNRRDSDVVRDALASPRKILGDKDPNSPSKYDTEVTLDLSQTFRSSVDKEVSVSPTPEQAETEDTTDAKSTQGSRRSSRAKKSRLPAPAPAAQTQTSKIAIRRTDGSEHVVLKKSDAQELANITRINTRKNKQGAFGVNVRLLKLAMEAYSLPPLDESTKEIVIGKNIRWDEQLTYYQENSDNAANQLAEAESLATPDELSLPTPSSVSSAKPKPKISSDAKDSKDKQSTPKIRRVRGLGTTNGTPGKGLLAAASLLPDAVQEEKDASSGQSQRLPKPKSSKLKRPFTESSSSSSSSSSSTQADTKLATLEVTPVGIEPSKERKSRLATPKKVKLPQPIPATVVVDGKENSQRSGLGDATPKKGIPVPKVVVPSGVGMESGLPRRRGRKV